MSEIKKNINSIKEKLNLHTSKVEEKIRMVAVSKGQDQSKIREAFDSGQYIFGENYLQEAINKQEALTDLSIEWHFIGPIQSNKCKLIAESFSWVQSIDRIKVANKLNDSLKNHASLNICLLMVTSNTGQLLQKKLYGTMGLIIQMVVMILKYLHHIHKRRNKKEL